MSYITGELIKQLREKRKLTQRELAERIMVSDKTVSKWETGKGLPDIGIIEDLAKALGISVADLLTGEYRENDNISANMRKAHFYVCPICGNIIVSVGIGSYSCCGIALPEAEVEKIEKAEVEKETESGEVIDDSHDIRIETIDHEYYISMKHVMHKNHYISFIAYVTSDSIEIKKLYPEQDIELRFRKKGHGYLYAYCNRHGMYQVRI